MRGAVRGLRVRNAAGARRYEANEAAQAPGCAAVDVAPCAWWLQRMCKMRAWNGWLVEVPGCFGPPGGNACWWRRRGAVAHPVAMHASASGPRRLCAIVCVCRRSTCSLETLGCTTVVPAAQARSGSARSASGAWLGAQRWYRRVDEERWSSCKVHVTSARTSA